LQEIYPKGGGNETCKRMLTAITHILYTFHAANGIYQFEVIFSCSKYVLCVI